MAKKRTTANRRDFLVGKSALQTVQDQVSANLGESEDLEPADSQPNSYILNLSRRAMATEFQLYLNARKDQWEVEVALKSLDQLEVLEDQMSVYRDHSDVSKLNRNAATSAQPVEEHLFRLLQRAQEYFDITGGAFDITSTPLSKLWGFFHRQARLPPADDIARTLQSIGGQHVHIDVENQQIRFDSSAIELNLGAIGKGFAIDRVVSDLQSADLTAFLLHGGRSSVLAVGCRDGVDGWRVELKHPLLPARPLGEFLLRDQAMGTSGCGNQFFYHQGKRMGHIIDPRTGHPADGVYSATVIAPDATAADALATAFYVMGVEHSREFCQEHPEIAGLLVIPGRQVGNCQTVVVGSLGDTWRPNAN
ncbi:MAG TPA: FAD:protein FMN transferase [Planctomycetes bacterium]|nr:FAD:protein FMN transferase [Planctomycetota bacterium]